MKPPRLGERRAASRAAAIISPEMMALNSKTSLAAALASFLAGQWPGSGGVCPAERHHWSRQVPPNDFVKRRARARP